MSQLTIEPFYNLLRRLVNFSWKPVKQASSAGVEATSRDGLLATISRLEPEQACASLATATEGLSNNEAAARLRKYGPHLGARERKATIPEELWSRTRNPLNALLLTLAVVSYFLGDIRAAVVIAMMVVLAITTAFIQEHRSNEAAARLVAMVHTTESVRRRPNQSDDPYSEVPIDCLVPGDVVRLSAGDMIPADVRLLEAKDLFVNQSTMTGESMPAEKHAEACTAEHLDPFDLPNLCFMGANVVTGYGTGVVLRTGSRTFFGKLAHEIAGRRIPTAFDRGINKFTWLMIRFILVMVPAVFLINGLTKHDWRQALLFEIGRAHV